MTMRERLKSAAVIDLDWDLPPRRKRFGCLASHPDMWCWNRWIGFAS